jgi:Uma2 family endonuclease
MKRARCDSLALMVQATLDLNAGDQSAVNIRALSRHLPLRLTLAQALDDAELFEFCRVNRELRIERTAAGELVIMSLTGSETGRRNFNLIAQLGAWAARDGTGVGFDSSTGFILPNGAERSPDAAWVRRAAWAALSTAARAKFAPLCPDFVVELCAPSDDLRELHEKLQEYLRCGARLGWLIDPEARRIWVYRPGAPVEEMLTPTRVSADPELPGFELDCEPIW